MTFKKYLYAFTLVELAIVMTIIGLLIGGILKGQELLENARITALVAQTKTVEAALTGFRDKYDAIPGDGAALSAKLPGCVSPCVDGDGNGHIGDTTPQWWLHINSSIIGENIQFWKHLALAGLIGGIDTTATTANQAIGKLVPAARIGGGLFAHSNSWGFAGPFSWAGMKITLRKDPGGSGDPCRYDLSLCALTPAQAAQLDRKMDDGMAALGRVRAVSSVWAAGCDGSTVTASGYDEARTGKSCELITQID